MTGRQLTVRRESVGEYLQVVADTHPFGVLGGIELAEGQVNTLNEGPDETDEERREGGKDENGCKLFDGPLHQIHALFGFGQVNLPFYPVFARILPDAACMLRRSERSGTAVFTDTRS